MSFVSRLVPLVVAAMLGAAAWGYAQSKPSPPQHLPFVVSGQDIGFEIVEMRRGKPMGRLMVRMGGEWKEAAFAHTVTPVQ